MMYEIKKIDILSLAKIFGVLYFLLGLIVGFIFFFISLVGLIFSENSSGAMGSGVLSIILFPLFYGFTGFISGIIMGFIYNFISDWIGGIKLELKKSKN